MKIDRLIGIITLLLQKDQTTAPELAQRFEVSRRTIQRDIEDICRAGIPVVTVPGYGGGISLAQGYKVMASLLTSGELQAVLAGVKGVDSVSRTSYFQSLADKLHANSGTAAADYFDIDLASHYQDSLTQKIELLKGAIARRRVVCFDYYSAAGRSRRTVEPHQIIFRWAAWYVMGYCLLRNDFRLFKLNRIWALQETEVCFLPREVPAERLDLDAHLTRTKACLQAVFSPSQAYRLVEQYGPDSFTYQPDGRLLFQRNFSSYDHMRAWILGFGDCVEVMQPQQLREDILRQAQTMAHIYSAKGN